MRAVLLVLAVGLGLAAAVCWSLIEAMSGIWVLRFV